MTPAPSPEITLIDIKRDTHELVLTWDDGFSGSLGLTELRLACPCAACRGSRDAGLPSWPTASSPSPLALSHAEITGAWGLSITWNDGHSTGIYPFVAMRAWIEADEIEVVGDSGLGGFTGGS